MKKLLLALTVLLAATAQAQDPILNLQVRAGKFEDTSTAKRTVTQKTLESKEGGSLVTTFNAAKITYKQDDPLFQPGARTWLIRCQLQDEPTEGYFPLLGQWKASTNERLISIILKGGSPGALSFHISPDGFVPKQVVRALPSVPRNSWMTLAAQFTPGAEVALTAFDDKGNILSQSKTGPVAPAAVFSAPVDFELNAPNTKGAMQVSAVQVWNGNLTQEQITRGLPALGAK